MNWLIYWTPGSDPDVINAVELLEAVTSTQSKPGPTNFKL